MRAGGALSVLVVGVIVGLAYKYYFAGSAASGVATPMQTINIVGVKNDLIGIGQAERAYQAQNGKYVSLDELISSGSLRMEKTGRAGYTYEVVTSGDTYQAIAHCPTAAMPGCTNFSIDPTMEVQPAP
jgi:hypothetical protein